MSLVQLNCLMCNSIRKLTNEQRTMLTAVSFASVTASIVDFASVLDLFAAAAATAAVAVAEGTPGDSANINIVHRSTMSIGRPVA